MKWRRRPISSPATVHLPSLRCPTRAAVRALTFCATFFNTCSQGCMEGNWTTAGSAFSLGKRLRFHGLFNYVEHPPPSLALLYNPACSAFIQHLHHTNGDTDGALLPGPFAVHRKQWQQYCQQVERSIRGDGEDSDIQASVFGACRRCGSRRLLVTTRQLRRADEGMTELRQCRTCGHVTKVNS